MAKDGSASGSGWPGQRGQKKDRPIVRVQWGPIYIYIYIYIYISGRAMCAGVGGRGCRRDTAAGGGKASDRRATAGVESGPEGVLEQWISGRWSTADVERRPGATSRR